MRQQHTYTCPDCGAALRKVGGRYRPERWVCTEAERERDKNGRTYPGALHTGVKYWKWIDLMYALDQFHRL